MSLHSLVLECKYVGCIPEMRNIGECKVSLILEYKMMGCVSANENILESKSHCLILECKLMGCAFGSRQDNVNILHTYKQKLNSIQL